jgi:hypothetical protein
MLRFGKIGRSEAADERRAVKNWEVAVIGTSPEVDNIRTWHKMCRPDGWASCILLAKMNAVNQPDVSCRSRVEASEQDKKRLT